MKLRSVAPYVVVVAVLLVASLESASPGAHPDPDPRNLDLLASAQPTTAQPVVSDAAFDELKTRDWDVKADAAATTSADCDGCIGESTALQIVYASRAGLARLDNSAVAWTQTCQGCTGAALSVQVVVLSGRSEVAAQQPGDGGDRRLHRLPDGCRGLPGRRRRRPGPPPLARVAGRAEDLVRRAGSRAARLGRPPEPGAVADPGPDQSDGFSDRRAHRRHQPADRPDRPARPPVRRAQGQARLDRGAGRSSRAS